MAVWTEGDRRDRLRVAVESFDEIAGRSVPNLYGLVFGGRGDLPIERVKGNALDL